MILEPPKIKSVIVSTFSLSICHEVMRPDALILVFWWVLSQIFSLSKSFTLIKKLFSSFSLLAIRVVSSAYLRLIFLLAILIPVCNSSGQAFCIMCSVYELNKEGDNIQTCHTPFSILNQSVVPYKVLPVASWPAYRFLRRQDGLIFPSV